MAADLTISALKSSYATWDATRIAADDTFYLPFGEDFTVTQTELATGGGGGGSTRPSTGMLYPRFS